MPSPFPGMDPYLEGYLWPDVHQRLATKLSQLLTPQLRPRYVARLAVSVIEDETAEAEIGVMYPDVEVLRSSFAETRLPPAQTPLVTAMTETPTLDAPMTLPLNIRFRQVTVEVRDAAKNELVTTIEILSPVNKREPGLTRYREKRKRLYASDVHLLEIDFLRRGERIVKSKNLNGVPYLATLTRAGAERIGVWPIRLQDKLPALPVPLRAPDAPVPLNLQAALNAIYDEAAYDLSINYSQPPPPPPLSAEETAWIQTLLAKVTNPTP